MTCSMNWPVAIDEWQVRYSQSTRGLSSDKQTHVVNHADFRKIVKKCVSGLCNSDTRYPDKQIYYILPRSNNSFRSPCVRPSLLPCKLSPRSYWTRSPLTDIFQVDRLEAISFLFVFLFVCKVGYDFFSALRFYIQSATHLNSWQRYDRIKK